MSLDSLAAAVARQTDDDGTVRESALAESWPIRGTIGEVLSLNPPRVQILSGRTIRPRAYQGPVPAVGDRVLVLSVGRMTLVLTGVEVI